MKKLLFLLIPLITLYAQVIDTVIPLFDEPRDHLLYIPQGNKLYIYFDNTCRFLVLDCSTYTVRKIIQIPIGYPSSVNGVWNRRRDKIYIAFSIVPESIAVIDNRTDSIIKWINFHSPGLPCYNSKDDKVYVFGGNAVAVIDCATDSIIKTITQPYALSGFVLWDSIGNKVYCGSGLFHDEVTVINCVNDSIIAVINTNVVYPDKAALNSQRRKLYVGSDIGNIGAVIDVIADTLIKNFQPVFCDIKQSLIWNSLEDKIYWPHWPNDIDTIHVINCQNDSIIKNVELSGAIDFMCLATWSNRLFVSTDAGDFNILNVLDCRNDSVISQCRFGKNAEAMTCNPIDQRIYIIDQWDSALYVFRDEIAEIEEIASPNRVAMTNRFEIYPNPARSVIRVRVPFVGATSQSRPSGLGNPSYNKEEMNLKIFDVSGKLIKEIPAFPSVIRNDDRDEMKISLKGINPGIYFLQVGKEIKKFLVVRQELKSIVNYQ
jgi:DNA-binding beta-propeller fold protein YncE